LPVSVDQNVIDGLIASNAPPDVIEAARRNLPGAQADDCDVWEENWESVMLFVAVGTQWTVSPGGQAIGIHYASLESAMNMRGIKKKKRPALFEDIRLMELTALEVFREKSQCQH